MKSKNAEQKSSTQNRLERRTSPERRAFSLIVKKSIDESGSIQLDAVIHELRVRQIGLEILNADLRSVNATLKKSNNHYFKMYEFAPIGYVSLSSEGVITEMNLTSAAMLGIERGKLIHHLFSRFIMLEDSARWHSYFAHIKQYKNEDSIELTLRTPYGSGLSVQLNSVYVAVEDLIPSFHITVTDITKIKLAEKQLQITSQHITSNANSNVNVMNENPNHNIRVIRQIKGWSQEEMAERISMSLNGYGCIERGETDISLSRLKQIAAVFNISVCELLEFDEENIYKQTKKQVSGHQNNYGDHTNSNEHHKKYTDVLLKLEKQKVIAEQKEKENAYLKEMLLIVLASRKE